MSGSRAIAEDVTQEVFLALIRSGLPARRKRVPGRDSGGYQPTRGSLGGYLYGIARHLVLRALEHERRPAQAADDGDGVKLLENLSAAGGDPHAELVRNQRTERLWGAVLGLPVHYREALVLCELHEMNYAEAAQLLGCGIGTVRSRLHRARAMLTERLRSAGSPATQALGTVEPNGCAI